VQHIQQISFLITTVSYRAVPFKYLYRDASGFWLESVLEIL